MDAQTALDKAIELKKSNRKIDASELDELARLLAASPKASHCALAWVLYIGTHVDEMAQVILSERNKSAASFWTLDAYCDQMKQIVLDGDSVFRFVRWIKENKTRVEDHVAFKLRAIELNQVEMFVGCAADFGLDYNSLEKFYSDLPSEVKLGVRV